MAAILSGLKSRLNSASTLFTMDFVKTFRLDTSQDALVAIGRAATSGFTVIAAAYAPQITNFPTDALGVPAVDPRLRHTAGRRRVLGEHPLEAGEPVRRLRHPRGGRTPGS